jgi:hypothetical protein
MDADGLGAHGELRQLLYAGLDHPMFRVVEETRRCRNLSGARRRVGEDPTPAPGIVCCEQCIGNTRTSGSAGGSTAVSYLGSQSVRPATS